MIRLSVIIPGFNTPNEMWQRCLRSVLAAVPEQAEVICVDDGSKERPSVDVDDCRVRWIYLEKNGGQSSARNKALELAKGEYVTFVDSDDEVSPDVYLDVLKGLNDCAGDVGVFGVRTEWVKEGLYKINVPRRGVLGLLSKECALEFYENCLIEYVWNKVFRRAFLDKHSIRFREWACPGEDTIFVLECMKNGSRWSAFDQVGYMYCRYDGSSLSRYQPHYADSMKLKAMLWKEVCGLEPSDSSERYRTDMEWDNMWRRGSPFGMLERLRFAMEHRISFPKMLLKQLIRRYCYVRPLRRFKIKRMFPEVKEVEA